MPMPRSRRHLGRVIRGQVTFDGTANRGNVGDQVQLFDVTGLIMITGFFIYVRSALTAGANVTVGTPGNLAAFMASVTSASMTQGIVWADIQVATRTFLDDADSYFASDDIVIRPSAASLATGTIDVYLEWVPLSDDASVVPGTYMTLV